MRQSVIDLGGKDVPDKALLRRGDVRRALGITHHAVMVLVEDGLLKLAGGQRENKKQ